MNWPKCCMVVVKKIVNELLREGKFVTFALAKQCQTLCIAEDASVVQRIE